MDWDGIRVAVEGTEEEGRRGRGSKEKVTVMSLEL